MSRDPHDAATEAKLVANVANAVMAAQNFDATQCARGLAIMSLVVVGDDPVARIALAREMLQLIRELDPDMLAAQGH